MGDSEMLEKQRNEIDELDKQLVELFEKRMALVTEIGKIKQKNNLPIFDESREIAVIERAVSRLENPMYKPYASCFFKDLMEVTKKYQLSLIEK
ncbi:Chorismate mutase [Carnobacterium divergens]|nr:Chorismate mutase [Carnobacterium divergens]